MIFSFCLCGFTASMPWRCHYFRIPLPKRMQTIKAISGECLCFERARLTIWLRFVFYDMELNGISLRRRKRRRQKNFHHEICFSGLWSVYCFYTQILDFNKSRSLHCHSFALLNPKGINTFNSLSLSEPSGGLVYQISFQARKQRRLLTLGKQKKPLSDGGGFWGAMFARLSLFANRPFDDVLKYVSKLHRLQIWAFYANTLA